ncbi:hypothetical protein [Rhizobium sp. PL01]|uniref:hypothetical protein n=1 Tax=Rhizobium sp. PL01 TaxID=3085631 RepID=UPI002980E01B|nr:hypothetical protein [Rhizobium sp. PL01]
MDAPVNAPAKLIELPHDTREWLATLREDELETLKALVDLPANDVRDGFKLVRDLRTVGRFIRFSVVLILAMLVATVTLYENMIKVFSWFKAGTPH